MPPGCSRGRETSVSTHSCCILQTLKPGHKPEMCNTYKLHFSSTVLHNVFIIPLSTYATKPPLQQVELIKMNEHWIPCVSSSVCVMFMLLPFMGPFFIQAVLSSAPGLTATNALPWQSSSIQTHPLDKQPESQD